jgi:hypothetical protein
MKGQTCQACGKGLTDKPGPALFDDHGHWYHLACWCKHMDALSAGQREAIERTATSVADPGDRGNSPPLPDPA